MILSHHQEALAVEIFRKMGIPAGVVGDADVEALKKAIVDAGYEIIG